MATDPRSVVLRWFDELWSQRREETIDELLSDDSVCYADTGEMRGREEFRDRMYRPFVAAFPDLSVSLEDVIVEGEKVAVRWNAHGTHSGAGLGFEKTDRPVNMRGITILRVADGKLMEGWQSSNIPEAMASLRS